MIFGIDYLGGSRYKDVILNHHPKGWAAGFFVEQNLFQTSPPQKQHENVLNVIQKLLDRGDVPAIRVHLNWDDNHIYSFSDLQINMPVIAKLSAMFSQSPVPLYLSPFCEHNLDPQTFNKAAELLQSNLPFANIINSPLSLTPRTSSRRYEDENHHGTYASSIFSYDGESCFDSDVLSDLRLHRASKIFFFWCPSCNGHPSMPNKEHPAKPRHLRESFLTPELIESMVFLSKPTPSLTLPSGWIWKSHSDSHGRPVSSRDYRPVLVCPIKVPHVTLCTKKGVPIEDSSSPTQQKGSSNFLYRFTKYGYQYPRECLLVAGNEKHPVTPAFRMGSFR
jgi:hypothetical protein